MAGDFFTKPLQGALFKKFRDKILNVQVGPGANSPQDHRSVLGNEPHNGTGTTKKRSYAEVVKQPESALKKKDAAPVERTRKVSFS